MDKIAIPGFVIEEELGEGGLATVWKARQLSLDRIVALKFLPSDSAADTEHIRRFHDEVSAAAKIKHSGIVQVYDVKFEQGLHYIVMEYVAGYTVREWLRRSGRLEESEALQIVECVADALGYAWDRERVVHCDIKPDNVIIDSDGAVKVANLGLARSSSVGAIGRNESHIFGTPSYISPEQVMGVPDIDCRSDIYSLGATLYELLTGTQLFQGNTDEKIVEMQVASTVEDPIKTVPTLSKEVCWFLEKMLAKDRARRHQSCAEVLADIAKVRNRKMSGPLVPEGASTIRRCKRPTTRVPVVSARTEPVNVREARSPLLVIFVVMAMIAALVAGVVYMRSSRLPAVSSVEAVAASLFDEAMAWARDNPAQYGKAIERFQTVRTTGPGTKYAGMAELEIKKLSEVRAAAVQSVITGLDEKVAPMIEAGLYGDAVAVYESYNGMLSSETRSIRLSLARQIREKQRKAALELSKNAPPIGQAEMDRLLDSVAVKLLSDGIDAALVEMSKGMASRNLASRVAELKPVRDLLDTTSVVQAKIIDSFKPQRGKQISVSLISGTVNLFVSSVENGKVSGIQQKSIGGTVVSIPLSFGLKDLSQSEKDRRMGAGDRLECSLAKGLLAFSSKAYPQAQAYFAKTHPLLSARLLALIPGS